MQTADAVIAGVGLKAPASALPVIVPHQMKPSACACPNVKLSVAAEPTVSPVNFLLDMGMLPVTVDCPSTAIDCVKAVAI